MRLPSSEETFDQKTTHASPDQKLAGAPDGGEPACNSLASAQPPADWLFFLVSSPPLVFKLHCFKMKTKVSLKLKGKRYCV